MKNIFEIPDTKKAIYVLKNTWWILMLLPIFSSIIVTFIYPGSFEAINSGKMTLQGAFILNGILGVIAGVLFVLWALFTKEEYWK